MQKQTNDLEAAEAKRRASWDRFLDAYSIYLGEPTVANAASLKLAGAELEKSDDGFDLESFVARLGWHEEVEC